MLIMTLPSRFVLLFLVFITQAAMACKCAPPPPNSDWFEWQLRGNSAVFSGTVESIQITGRPLRPVAGETVDARIGLIVSFSAVHGYRGEVGTTIRVETGIGNGDCGFDFQRDRSYLVFAEQDGKGHLTTGICSGTLLLKAAGRLIELLGGTPSLPEQTSDSQPDNTQEENDGQICGRISVTTKKKIETAGQIAVWRVEDEDIAEFRSDIVDIEPDGNYCVDNLPPGRYIVQAMRELDDWANWRLMAYYPGVLKRSAASFVGVDTKSKTIHANFSLVEQHLYTVHGYLRGAPLNKPIQIFLMGGSLNSFALIEPVELGPNGSFEFASVPSGHYTAFAGKDNNDESFTFLSDHVEVDVGKNIEGLNLDYFVKK
ncbi:MAG TPA: hypothetical protein VGN44_18825 [Candidatus Angelobacter sp.]